MMDFDSLPRGAYSVILADPPWRFVTYGENGHGKSPEQHYPTIPIGELMAMPISELAASDCHLLMWSTWPHLAQAMSLLAAWGFTYKTGGAWGKRSSSGDEWAFGTGYIFRSASEPLLVATRGKPKWHSKSERNLWIARIREHSRKPVQVHEMIERSTRGERLELFARSGRPGWTVWGNEADKFDIGRVLPNPPRPIGIEMFGKSVPMIENN